MIRNDSEIKYFRNTSEISEQIQEPLNTSKISETLLKFQNRLETVLK